MSDMTTGIADCGHVVGGRGRRRAAGAPRGKLERPWDWRGANQLAQAFLEEFRNALLSHHYEFIDGVGLVAAMGTPAMKAAPGK